MSVTDRARVALVARGVGVSASVLAAVGWLVFVFRNPYAPPAEGVSLLIGGTMTVACIVAVGAALRGAHIGMYLLFLVSFLPEGLSTLLSPGVFQVIGWCNLVYLASAVCIHASLPRHRSA